MSQKSSQFSYPYTSFSLCPKGLVTAAAMKNLSEWRLTPKLDTGTNLQPIQMGDMGKPTEVKGLVHHVFSDAKLPLKIDNDLKSYMAGALEDNSLEESGLAEWLKSIR